MTTNKQLQEKIKLLEFDNKTLLKKNKSLKKLIKRLRTEILKVEIREIKTINRGNVVISELETRVGKAKTISPRVFNPPISRRVLTKKDKFANKGLI